MSLVGSSSSVEVQEAVTVRAQIATHVTLNQGHRLAIVVIVTIHLSEIKVLK